MEELEVDDPFIDGFFNQEAFILKSEMTDETKLSGSDTEEYASSPNNCELYINDVNSPCNKPPTQKSQSSALNSLIPISNPTASSTFTTTTSTCNKTQIKTETIVAEAKNHRPIFKKETLQIQPVSAPAVQPSSKKRKISESTQTIPVTPQKQQKSEESEYAKRQQRLIKNREAASISRQKRKQHLQHLESKVSELEKENSELRKRVEILESKNKELIRSSKPVAKSAGAVVMVLFFSFALLLRPVHDNLENKSVSTIRSLQSINPSERMILEYQPMKQEPEEQNSAIINLNPKPEKVYQLKNQTEEYSNKELPFDSDFEDSHTLVHVSDLQSWIDQKISNSPTPNSVMLSTQVQPNNFDRKDGVAYMFCSHVHQILPNEKDSQGKPQISLLIPFESSEEGETEKFVQIDCEVIGTKTFFRSKPNEKETQTNSTTS